MAKAGDATFELIVNDTASAAFLRVAEAADNAAESVRKFDAALAAMHASIREATGRAPDA